LPSPLFVKLSSSTAALDYLEQVIPDNSNPAQAAATKEEGDKRYCQHITHVRVPSQPQATADRDSCAKQQC
jgi:hypothetical protein